MSLQSPFLARQAAAGSFDPRRTTEEPWHQHRRPAMPVRAGATRTASWFALKKQRCIKLLVAGSLYRDHEAVLPPSPGIGCLHSPSPDQSHRLQLCLRTILSVQHQGTLLCAHRRRFVCGPDLQPAISAVVPQLCPYPLLPHQLTGKLCRWRRQHKLPSEHPVRSYHIRQGTLWSNACLLLCSRYSETHREVWCRLVLSWQLYLQCCIHWLCLCFALLDRPAMQLARCPDPGPGGSRWGFLQLVRHGQSHHQCRRIHQRHSRLTTCAPRSDVFCT